MVTVKKVTIRATDIARSASLAKHNRGTEKPEDWWFKAHASLRRLHEDSLLLAEGKAAKDGGPHEQDTQHVLFAFLIACLNDETDKGSAMLTKIRNTTAALDNGVETLKVMRGQDVRITNSQADDIDAKLKLVTVSTTDAPHQVQMKFNEIERLMKQLPESRKGSSTRPIETLIEAIIPAVQEVKTEIETPLAYAQMMGCASPTDAAVVTQIGASMAKWQRNHPDGPPRAATAVRARWQGPRGSSARQHLQEQDEQVPQLRQHRALDRVDPLLGYWALLGTLCSFPHRRTGGNVRDDCQLMIPDLAQPLIASLCFVLSRADAHLTMSMPRLLRTADTLPIFTSVALRVWFACI